MPAWTYGMFVWRELSTHDVAPYVYAMWERATTPNGQLGMQ